MYRIKAIGIFGHILLFLIFSGFCTAQNKLNDSDENRNSSVKIGKQVWQAKNLNIQRFRNGDRIRIVKTASEWADAASKKEPACCHYEFKSKNAKKYGKLYNWYAVNDLRGLAPEGWHIATADEITVLSNFLGIEAGIKLKSKKNWHFDKSNPTMISLCKENKGTDLYGFNAKAGGYIDSTGEFQLIKSFGYWWTADEAVNISSKSVFSIGSENKKANSDSKNQNDYAAFYWLEFFSKFLDIHEAHKSSGFSVRCIKN